MSNQASRNPHGPVDPLNVKRETMCNYVIKWAVSFETVNYGEPGAV